MSKKHIEECIRTSLEGYFKDLRGTEPDGMYDMMVKVVEKPLLEVVMSQADNNQSRAAEWLKFMVRSPPEKPLCACMWWQRSKRREGLQPI